MTTRGCLDDNEAIALLVGSDDGDRETARARAHVHQCEACRALVAAVAKLVIDGSEPARSVWLDAIRPGAKIGPYRVEDTLGRGAMGTVYRAHDERLRRPVALKLLAADLDDDRALRRLRAEAQSMARLAHPNVVEVLDVGRSPHGPYVAMELVDGGDLRQWLAAGTRTPTQILTHLAQAGRGLAAAHAAGVVHRDFKPANVLVGSDERVRVADFGLAVLRRPRDITATHVATGELTANVSMTGSEAGIAGTPAYMAPEQMTGGRVGPAADQFSFCVTLYEALAGKRPFDARTSAGRLQAIAGGRLDPLPTAVPRHVATALRRGLAEDPAARFVDMNALLTALSSPPAATRRRRGMVAGVIGLAALGVVLGRPAAGPCDDLPAQLPWNEQTRASLRRDWSATGVDEPHTDRMLAELDRHALRWEQARADACRPDAPPPPQTRACLQGLRTEFEGFTAEAADARESQAEGFIRTVGKLRAPDSCADVSANPVAPALADAMSRLRARYLAVEARGAPAETRSLRPQIVSLHDRAQQAGAGEVQARLAQMLGVLDTKLGELATAAEWLERGYFVAEEIGELGLAFDCALSRSMVSGPFIGDPDDAWKWVRHARATNERLGDPLRATQLLAHEGDLHLVAGEHDAARDVLLRAKTMMPENAPDTFVVSLYSSLGQLLVHDDDDGPCREAFNHAITYGEEHLGPAHFDLIRPLMGIATCELEPGLYPSAQAHLQRAIALAKQHGHVLAEALARGNLGLMHRNLERPTAALREAIATYETLKKVHGSEDNIRMARTNTNLAESYANAGQFDKAADAARRALRYYDAQPEPSGMRYGTQLTLTWARLELGEPDLVPTLERLVAQAPTDNYRIEASITLAQAYLPAGRADDVVRLLASDYADGARVPEFAKLRFAEGRAVYARALAELGRDEDAATQRRLALKLARAYEDDPRGIAERIEAAT